LFRSGSSTDLDFASKTSAIGRKQQTNRFSYFLLRSSALEPGTYESDQAVGNALSSISFSDVSKKDRTPLGGLPLFELRICLCPSFQQTSSIKLFNRSLNRAKYVILPFKLASRSLCEILLLHHFRLLGDSFRRKITKLEMRANPARHVVPRSALSGTMRAKLIQCEG